MASVEDVLANMAEPNREEEELCFVIDKDFRLISVPERGTVLGVEGDKDVNLVRFRMPRYYTGDRCTDRERGKSCRPFGFCHRGTLRQR